MTFSGASQESANCVGRGKVKVIKSDKFVGMDAVCLIGRLVDGAVAKKMCVHGKESASVLTVESKYGEGACTKIGAQVVLMIQGLEKDDFPSGTEIILTKGAQCENSKPKGKIIIA
jgi:hypothetical protein